ncbi:MAG: vitamin K epoxide reductase family protein [Nanoarchaeota archaeon]
MNSLKKLILVFIVLEILFSILLAYSYYSNKIICAPGFDCADVQKSQYSEIFGIKLPVIGIISFTALCILFFFSQKNEKIEYLFITAAFIGALGAIRFLYIQFIILKKICSNCLAIDILAIAIFIFAFYDFKKSSRYATP